MRVWGVGRVGSRRLSCRKEKDSSVYKNGEIQGQKVCKYNYRYLCAQSTKHKL